MRDKILNVILLVVIILLFWKGCQIQKDRDNLSRQVSAYSIGEKEFKKRRQDDSSTIASQSQTLLSQSDALKMGLLKLEGDIKDVQSQVRQRQRIVIDTQFVPFVPDNYIDSAEWILKFMKGDRSKDIIDSLITHSLIVPKKFDLTNKWFKFNGEVRKNGLNLDSMRIYNESSVTIGYKKGGFLNLKRIPIVEVKNTNPYFDVSGLNNVVIKEKKTILQSKWFWGGLGVIGGILINSK